jgi:hypothetical protein
MIVFPRDQWQSMGDTGWPAVVDISVGPLSRIAQDSCFVAAEATRTGPHLGQVDVYRRDPRDPKPFNVDRYDVIDNIAGHPNLQEWIDAADTIASPELTEYLSNHVFLHRQKPDGSPWHWKSEEELPDHIRIVVKKE